VRRPIDEAERRQLGLDAPISRRDFLNGSLLAGGVAAAGVHSPGIAHGSQDSFTGFAGVGDYAQANGDTWPVIQAAHRLRDGGYSEAAYAAAEPAGQFDLVVVGGGIAGLSAARRFRQLLGAKTRVLVIENHAIVGGEARQNEFDVDGVRLLGPQGSNDFIVPPADSRAPAAQFFEDFALPREYQWQPWDAQLKPLHFARDNYANMDGFQETQVDVGYFFAGFPGVGSQPWRRNIWRSALADTPYSQVARRDLLRWRNGFGAPGDAESRYLDTLTYRDYLENVRGFDPAVTQMVEPIVGLLAGVSTDAACARLGRALVEDPARALTLSYPGGNSPFPRALLRNLIPAALPGVDFESLMYARVNFAALDLEGQQTRIRLNATALRVRHAGAEDKRVEVTYERRGKLFKVEAGGAVMASGGWINKHLLIDMPADLRAAYGQFAYAPALIVNVALRQWRFLYDLGVTACRWFDGEDGFGYCCNIRQNMVTARHAPPLHPDKPAILTFYMGLPVRGLPAAQQGMAARARLLNTGYAEFELRIRRQLLRLFGDSDFKADRDIAAIVLNRWGHARLIEPPGFHYGVDGRPSPLERVRLGYGRIAIGHSELNGAQHWGSALEYGMKAAEQAAGMA
jgi:spermidine dehydrogenase